MREARATNPKSIRPRPNNPTTREEAVEALDLLRRVLDTRFAKKACKTVTNIVEIDDESYHRDKRRPFPDNCEGKTKG